MTALAADKLSKIEAYKFIPLTLTSGTIAYKGGLAAMVLGTGKVVPASGATNQVVIGRFAEKVDASLADKTVTVDLLEERWMIRVVNGTSTDAIATTDLLRTAYIKDDQTATILPAGSSPMGLIWDVDTTRGVLIEVIPQQRSTTRVGSTLAFTSNDCALTAVQCVSGSVYDVPTTGAASTITLPVTGVADGTELVFAADGIKNGHTVTYQFGTTAISAALTASKRHRAAATKLGSGWVINTTVSP